MLGPLFFVAGINLAGFRAGCPNGTRQIGQIVIGTAIGLRFTPEVATVVLGQVHWMTIAAVVAVLLGGVGALIQVRIAPARPRDRVSSAACPAAWRRMLTLGDRFKAEPVAVALSQTVRVGIVVVTVPVGLTWLGTTGGEPFQSSLDPGGLVAAPGPDRRLREFRLSPQPAWRPPMRGCWARWASRAC